MGRSRARIVAPTARRGRDTKPGASDEVDWDAAFERRGIGWYCGFVFPLEDPVRGMSGDDIAAMPRCDRWHPTKELRDGCDHGGWVAPAVDQDAPDTVPGPSVPIETTGRVNRWDGSCLWCGRTVEAGAGQLVDIDGVLRPVHNPGDC